MADRKKRRKVKLSFAGIVVLDIVIFVFFTLILVTLILVSRSNRHQAAALSSEDRSRAVVVMSGSETTSAPLSITPIPVIIDPAIEDEETGNTDSEKLQETETPTISGDFSATFPSQDTGTGALYSYQTDTVRIAIRREQAYNATYFVADVWVKNIDAFQTSLAKNTYGTGQHEMPLDIANRTKATFAVTGDYYSAHKEGVVVRNGQLYRDVMSNDVCILRTDGTMQTYKKGAFSSIDTIDETVWQAWSFGPALVENGVTSDTSGSNVRVKNPRSAIGYYEPGHYCFIVVDGRQKGYSAGMTLDELAQTFVSLGCETAYNLDGGATAMMVFQGELVNQPVNGGRSASDIICFS